jgi:hypothetical protein
VSSSSSPQYQMSSQSLYGARNFNTFSPGTKWARTRTDERLREEEMVADERLREEETVADERLGEEETVGDERLGEGETVTATVWRSTWRWYPPVRCAPRAW